MAWHKPYWTLCVSVRRTGSLVELETLSRSLERFAESGPVLWLGKRLYCKSVCVRVFVGVPVHSRSQVANDAVRQL